MNVNAQIRNLTLVAIAAALPLAVAAESTATKPTSSSTTPIPESYSTRTKTPADPSAASTSATGSAGWNSDRTGSMTIRRISESNVDRQFTAKALIGKDVYDNSNKKVGEVRDVVLDSSHAQQLATALSMRSSGRSAANTSSSMSTATTTGSSTASTADTNAATRDRPTVGGAIDSISSTASDLASSFAASEPAAIISYGGFMGAGGTLFRVPLSQLRYDSATDHIALNVSDNELATLKNSDTGRNAAE